MTNIHNDESSNEEIKKQKTRISKENHSEIERRRRFTMNHYISQLSEIFSKGEYSRQKIKKITILKCAAAYIQKLRESEPTETSSLAFVNSEEQEFMAYDSICGFQIKIECINGIIIDVSESIDYCLGAHKNYFIGKSIYNFVYPDDCRKIYEQINLLNYKSLQIFDFKRGLTVVECGANQNLFKNRKFYARMLVVNSPSVNKEYFCQDAKTCYKFSNFQWAQSNKLTYDNGDYVLVEFSGFLEKSLIDNSPYLNFVGHIVEDSKPMYDKGVCLQYTIQLSLDGRINYIEKSDEMMYGYNEKELLSYPLALFVHPEDQPTLLEVLKLAKTENKNTQYFIKTRFMNKNGTCLQFKIRLKCIRSMFSSVPELYVLFMENDYQISSRAEALPDKCEMGSFINQQNNSVLDLCVSQYPLTGFGAKYSPYPTNFYINNSTPKRSLVPLNSETDFSCTQQINNQQANFGMSYNVNPQNLIPLNFHAPERYQNYQTLISQCNYGQYPYSKNNYQGMGQEPHLQVAAIDHGMYQSRFQNAYDPGIKDIEQIYYLKNSNQLGEQPCYIQNFPVKEN